MLKGAINLGQPINRSHPLNRGLNCWHMSLPGRTGGNRILDLVNKNHGTLTNGPTWQSGAGRPGSFGSIGFDGSNDYIGFSQLSFSTDVTVSCWVTWSSLARHCLFQNGNAAFSLGGSGTSIFWGFNVLSTLLSTSFTPTLDQWYHFVATQSATSPYPAVIYKDGLQLTSGNTSAFVADGSVHYWGNYSFTSGFHAGKMDDMRVWDRVLSADEVAALRFDSLTGYQQTLNRLPMRVFSDGGGAPAASPVMAGQYYDCCF